MVNWCWFWTPKTRFDISQHFFSQESQEWNTCTQMSKIDYLNSRPTTISLSKPCSDMFFHAFLMVLGTRAWLVASRMNPKTRIPWSVSAADGCLLRHRIGGGAGTVPLSWPHVVACCVWNCGVLSVEAESSEPESRWLQGFFCFKFSMVHAALDLCQKKGQISTRPFWFLGLGHTHTHWVPQAKGHTDWRELENEKKF